MLFKNSDVIINNGETPELRKCRKDILEIFSTAIQAVDPYKSVKKQFNGNKLKINSEEIVLSNFKNIYLIGFGKASVGMAQAVCDSIDVIEGKIITNDPSAKLDHKHIEILFGDHPIPNKRNIQATEKIIELIKKCKENDLIISLISGGGSALLCKPRIELDDVQSTTDLLLKSGADIKEINTIRKHISYVKGGQLAKLSKCRIVTFIISDVIADSIDSIASGPTSPDSTTFLDARNILLKYNIYNKVPPSVNNIINDGLNGKISENPKIGDPVFAKIENVIVANNKSACIAAEKKSKLLGYDPIILSDTLDGESRDVGLYLIDQSFIKKINEKKNLLISGGETTVTITGNGRGGRNQEMVLSIVKAISNKKVIFSSFATDGIDGNSDAAGAIADRDSYKRALDKKNDPMDFLMVNNSYEFFDKIGDLLITGTTGTNVMDLQVIINME